MLLILIKMKYGNVISHIVLWLSFKLSDTMYLGRLCYLSDIYLNNGNKIDILIANV